MQALGSGLTFDMIVFYIYIYIYIYMLKLRGVE